MFLDINAIKISLLDPIQKRNFMTTIVTKLSNDLQTEIKTADEIWVAVALMNYNGLHFLLNNMKKMCLQNYLIGVDLPTDPKALQKLNELQLTSDIKVQLFTNKEYFHPKLYLVRRKNTYSAFVGSANCTNGGLFENVELSINSTDQKFCKEVLKWFQQHFDMGKPLTTNFVEQYQKDYKERQERKRQEEKTAKREKKILNEEFEATLSEKNEFLKILKQYRKDKLSTKLTYRQIVLDRNNTISQLRETLDYPLFRNLDIERFFKILELGHLIEIAKPTIYRQIPQLKKLLNYLCDESIDIAIRYDRAIKGDIKVDGVSKAFVSKVLALHRPDLYFVKNTKSERALRKYGILIPRGLTEGEKYKITCKLLRRVCKDTNIKDLATLDYYLYLEGNENK